MDKTIEDFLESNDKAELIERISDVLNTDGCRVLVITGVPNDKKGLDIVVRQHGHKYCFEVMGFMKEGFEILEQMGEEDES